ncbi:MAG TPA: peptidoglycan bridge formation glycyltransferase FemA/FemB family protein [Candidatus Polarisedimenticolia bacterium]|nr:peptidoglycan bridge formation glycyltransferase FemA/FemB family protein [Candidatus Polarisedimenticolia bacterium]
MSPNSRTAIATESAAPGAPAAPADRWAAWDRFLEATPATGFMQASWWADFRTTLGFSHFAVILKAGGRILGGALVQRLKHRCGVAFYYIQDGPVVPGDPSATEDVLAATLAAIEERRASETELVSHLRIEPRWETFPPNHPDSGPTRSLLPGFEPAPRRDRYREPRNTLCIDLRPPPAAILAAMRPKGRYNIAVARRHGVEVIEDTSPRGLADFLRIYRDTGERQGFRTKHATYFQSLMQHTAAAGRASIHFAEHAGQRLATALSIRFGSRATYFYGGSLAERRQVMAPSLLHFEILCRAREAGHEWYDLWGVDSEGDHGSSWAGLSAFKRRFGGREVTLLPTLDYVYDRSAYMQYMTAESTGRALPPSSLA